MQVATTSLERAKALYDLISGEARESELAGRLTDRAVQPLLDANLFSMLVARSNGGLEASRAEFFETVETIAKADGSAGWCLSVCATAAFVVSKAASAEVKQEVFGDGPVALWTSLLPRAQSVAVEAGYRVSGRFGWGSGSSLARWVVMKSEPLQRCLRDIFAGLKLYAAFIPGIHARIGKARLGLGVPVVPLR